MKYLLLALLLTACGVKPSTERLQDQIIVNKEHVTNKLVGGKRTSTTNNETIIVEDNNTIILEDRLAVLESEVSQLYSLIHQLGLRVEELESSEPSKKTGKGKKKDD